MTLPVSDIVAVSVSVSPTLPTETVNLGSMLVLGPSARLPLGNRLRFYGSLAAVGADFSTTDPEYVAAQVWFSQTPAPNGIKIARRYTAAAPAELLGGVTGLGKLSDFNGIAAGSFKITIDGTLYTATGINLTAAGSMAVVATDVQTVLNGLDAGVTVTWDGSHFIIRGVVTGTGGTITVASAAGSGTYLGILLGLDVTSQPTISNGIALETPVQSLNALRIIDQSWYGLFFTPEAEDDTDVEAIAAWAEANFVMYAYTSASSGIQSSGSTTDLAYLLKQSAYSRTIGQWDNLGNATSSYDILSAMACLFTTDFTQPNSSKILKFKLEPGVLPVPITEAQKQTLEAKNINYYATFGNTQMFSPGVMASGRFVDEVYGLDALNLQIQNNVFAYLVGRTNKVAQTDRDLVNIAQQIALACEQFVNAGFLAPGYWNGAAVGSIKTGDYLKAGYYVYIAPVSSQTSGQRASRLAPPITVIACGAGAVQQITINLNFQR